MIFKEYSLSPSPYLTAKDSDTFFGAEFEIEDILDNNHAGDFIGLTNDGSLRNNGVEYITSPLNLSDMVKMFDRLHETIEYGPNAFTDRTSIHVHVNCCNLYPQEVRNIVMLYALFEESFFNMVSPSRRNNIHCVALSETFLPSIYRHTCGMLVSKWHKYTALNLKPISTQGTMEFRHMHGHNDKALFTEWLTLISNLFKHGRTFKITSHTLEEKALEVMYTNLFGDTRLKDDWVNQRSLMGNQIIDVKLSTIS